MAEFMGHYMTVLCFQRRNSPEKGVLLPGYQATMVSVEKRLV